PNRYNLSLHDALPIFKLYKQEIKKEVEAKFAWFGKTVITEYKYIPLIADKTEKKHWEILNDIFAVVDYINKEKNIIHAITTENKDRKSTRLNSSHVKI